MMVTISLLLLLNSAVASTSVSRPSPRGEFAASKDRQEMPVVRVNSSTVHSLAVAAPAAAQNRRRVMLWWALPGLGASEPPTGHNQTEVEHTLSMLRAHRKGFTGIAFQYFSICGAYAGFGRHPTDWVQCNASQMWDPPHLAQAHPFGVPHDFGPQLKRALGDDVELWPVINFGNGYPGTSRGGGSPCMPLYSAVQCCAALNTTTTTTCTACACR